jgi:hypothetical protein
MKTMSISKEFLKGVGMIVLKIAIFIVMLTLTNMFTKKSLRRHRR